MVSRVSFVDTKPCFRQNNGSNIKFKAHFPKHWIESIRMDNAVEFSSCAFNDYCMALGVQVQHSVPYVHTQNGLAKSLIKKLSSLHDLC
jgi:hypothetical protein